MKTQNVNDAQDVNEVNNSFSACEEHANNLGALNMKNENSNANNFNGVYSIYRKSFAENDEIREFELVLRGDLDDKLKEIITYYKQSENATDIDIVDVVSRVGMMRCYMMCQMLVKSYFFKRSELDREFDIYISDEDIVDNKKHLIDVSGSENDIFWAKHEDPDPKKSKIFSVSTTEIDDISSMSFNISDVLSIYIEDCMGVFSDAYQYSADKTLSLMIQVGINRVYHCLSECFMLAELYENEIYGCDYD
jgi:hypothetical protein